MFDPAIYLIIPDSFATYQAHSQKILLGSVFEEKVDLLILQYSPGAAKEFIILWCMLIAHIYETLY